MEELQKRERERERERREERERERERLGLTDRCTMRESFIHVAVS